jgi:hypothetical protein
LTLKPGDEAAIIAVGVAVILAVSVGIFKAASFRGDMNSRWARRVGFAVAALGEKTIAELEQLRDAVDEALPSNLAGFDPSQAIADPAPLFKRADSVVKYYRARTGMEKDLVSLRRLGPVLVAALTGVDIATAALTVFFAELLEWEWIKPLGFALLIFSVLVLCLAGIVYIVLQDRLADGEILAGTGGRVQDSPES